jgi:preprotein translocase subunit SecG
MQKQTSLWITLLFGVLTVLFFIATIVLAILFGIERNKTKIEQVIQGMFYQDRRIKLTSWIIILVNDTNDLCLTSYCVEAG